MAFIKQEDYQSAVFLLNKFLKANGADEERKTEVAEAYYLLAKIYFEIKDDGKMEKALKAMAPDFSQEETDADFKKIIDHFTGDPLYPARNYFSKRLLDEALSFLNDFIKKNDTNENEIQYVAEAYYLLAKIHYQLRDDESMTSALQKTYEINPDFSCAEPNPDFKKKAALVKKELLQDSN